jgi:hypothetical protein
MRVLLVTSWDEACGIAEHSWYLKQAVEAADAEIEILPSAGALDPTIALNMIQYESLKRFDVLHLNYHAALHSRWTGPLMSAARGYGAKVLVTYHDTGVPNSDHCRAILGAADAGVVHEPYDDLPSQPYYWRMGVPGWPRFTWVPNRDWNGWNGDRPILGSIGFPFGWKNYDQLAAITAKIGWALLLIAPTATPEQIAGWQAINPHLYVTADFVGREHALAMLAACDATAFAYVCHNTGQSAAILQGIAARKPVIALSTCRQFRALHEEYPGSIRWAKDFNELELILKTLTLSDRPDPRTVFIAEQDSWASLGQKYADLYLELAHG